MSRIRLVLASAAILISAVGGGLWLANHNSTASHAQPSRVNPYYFVVNTGTERASAVRSVETKVGFKLNEPTANPAPVLSLRVVAAQMGPEGDLTPVSRRKAVFDYYESSFDGSDMGSYKGLRVQVLEFATLVRTDSQAESVDLAIPGYDVVAVYDRTGGELRGAGYFLSSPQRSFQVNVWDTSGTPQTIPDVKTLEPFLRSLAASVK